MIVMKFAVSQDGIKCVGVEEMKCECEDNIYQVSTSSSDGITRCAYCDRALYFYRTAEYDILNGWLDAL